MEWQRCVDLSVILADEGQSLPQLLRTTRQAGIEILGICGFLWGDYPLLHVLVQNAEARQTLENSGFDVRAESEVLVLRGERAGDLVARASQLLSDAGIRMGICYLVSDGGVVVGVDDFHRAVAVMDLWSQI